MERWREFWNSCRHEKCSVVAFGLLISSLAIPALLSLNGDSNAAESAARNALRFRGAHEFVLEGTATQFSGSTFRQDVITPTAIAVQTPGR